MFSAVNKTGTDDKISDSYIIFFIQLVLHLSLATF